MASHYVSSSALQIIAVYKTTNSNSVVVETIPQNSNIIVLEEYLGQNCKFHLISSSNNNVGYVLNEYIYPLSGTAESAPYVCSNEFPNFAYVQPEWQLLSSDQPYVDELTQEYCITITSTAKVPTSANQEEILKEGIKQLFKFYNKPYDDVTVQKYMNYYIFAKMKDSYVPYRPLLRIKYLVCIPKKYFDAIEDDTASSSLTPLERDISKADFLLTIDLKEKNVLFNSIRQLLNLYHDDVTYSNATLVFTPALLTGGQAVEDILQNEVVVEMAFNDKSQGVNNFLRELDNLLSLNNIDPNPSQNSPDTYKVQFAIDSTCNIIYDVSSTINGSCRKFRKGIEKFLKSESVADPTTVNFIKNIRAINQIQKCKVPWYEFAEQYVFPDVEVINPVIEENASSYEVFKRLYNKFLYFQKVNDVNPIKTYDEILNEQKQLLEFKSNYLFSSTTSPFLRLIYQGDNALDTTNLQRTLQSLDIAISESPLKNQDYNVVLPFGEQYQNVISSSGGWQIVGGNTELPPELFKINSSTPSITIDGTNYTLYTATKADVAKYQTKIAGDGLKTILGEIYNFINKIGFCKISDLPFGCLMFLARSLGIDIDASLTLSSVKSFDYEKLINEVIPYLPSDQQQFIYEQLLIELGCINKNAMLYILKNYLDSEEYETLNLESASYENIVTEVAKRMVVTVI
jgi:hypothetical protein